LCLCLSIVRRYSRRRWEIFTDFQHIVIDFIHQHVHLHTIVFLNSELSDRSLSILQSLCCSSSFIRLAIFLSSFLSRLEYTYQHCRSIDEQCVNSYRLIMFFISTGVLFPYHYLAPRSSSSANYSADEQHIRATYRIFWSFIAIFQLLNSCQCCYIINCPNPLFILIDEINNKIDNNFTIFPSSIRSSSHTHFIATF